MKKEIEVFGVTYDRYVLFQLHQVLTQTLNLSTIVEMPSHGAKAAGSLYAIGFAAAGCKVTLVNPEIETLWGWEKISLQDKVAWANDTHVYKTGFPDNAFDLAFNFVTWTELSSPALYLKEMKRISKKYVLLVTCNNFQPGYPWHRFLHRVFGFEWNHGQVEYNHITRVKKLFTECGLNITEYGAIDTPGWPDPSGPRDVRLHRRFGKSRMDHTSLPRKGPEWEVPFLEYVRKNTYPEWMKVLGRWDMRFRKGVFKLPMSHLFYVLGEKQKERFALISENGAEA
ncbi:class I SAM-dependent methyltransferase [Desulfosarcina sp. OttesenSCG-928-A07]|nr:class I SAM-dependent methyltransferase [Desulfosarcina sp. OttesenSCG-928-A07]